MREPNKKGSLYNQKNDEGKYLSGSVELLDESYGTGEYTPEGIPIVIWPEPSDIIDEFGFDKRNREANGKYTISYIIPRGTILIRYGSEAGSYTAPDNTPYEQLSLPYKKETTPYHKYKVLADDLVVTIENTETFSEYTKGLFVIKGVVAPAFQSKGGGIQFKHPELILQEVKAGKLERLDV